MPEAGLDVATKRPELPQQDKQEVRDVYETFLGMKYPEEIKLAKMSQEEIPPLFRNLSEGAREFALIEDNSVLKKGRQVSIPVIPERDEDIVRIVRNKAPRKGDQKFSDLYDESLVETARMLSKFFNGTEVVLDKHGTNHQARRAVKLRYIDNEDNKNATEEEKAKFRQYTEQVLNVNAIRTRTLTPLTTTLDGAQHFASINPELAASLQRMGEQLFYLRYGDPRHKIPGYDQMLIPEKVAYLRTATDFVARGLREMFGDATPTQQVPVI